MMAFWQMKYSSLSTEGSDTLDSNDELGRGSCDISETGLLEKFQQGFTQRTRPKQFKLCQYPLCLIIINIVLLLISLSVLMPTLYWQIHVDRKCMTMHSTASPALRDIDSKYYPVKFNGTLDYPSIYRQDPSPEVDEAWRKLQDVRFMAISEEDLLKAGKTTDAIRIPDQWGGGYMASLEFTHQLHCVDFLRKSLFRDYYQNRSIEFTDPPDIVHTHLLHCVEILRQFVMCHADVGVITHNWIKNYPRPYPDFSTWHQCRNFDSIFQWTKDHDMKGPPLGPSPHHHWAPEPGAVILDSPP